MILGDLSLPSLRSRQVLRSGLHAGTAASCLRAGVKTAVDGGIVRELCECAQYTIETRRRREAFSINASSVAILLLITVILCGWCMGCWCPFAAAGTVRASQVFEKRSG